MSCSVSRTTLAFLAALVLPLAAQAGELARPVPSNAQVTRFTRFNIRYTLRDIIASGVQKVEFYISDDMGATWRLYGEDADKTSPMTIEVPGEGVYGFVCVATDRHGNRERPPVARTRPETVIVVDRTPPQAKWIEPRQDILGRGQTIELSWESSDEHIADTPVKLQYAANASSNHDRNANWVTIEEGLPAVGTFKWTPPDSNRYNLRLIAEDRAGNMAVAYCPATLSVDNTPPYIQSVEPLRSNKLENDIIIKADDGANGSGVKEFSLYTSDNGAATWTLVKETTPSGESVPVKRGPGESIPFTAPRSGDFALWPVVFDNAGNATPLPAIAVTGPYVLTIDNEPPTVSLSNSFLMGRASVLSNESRIVEWTSYDIHLQNYSASILLSLNDGESWQELRSGMPTSGSESINFPFGSHAEKARLKVTVRDEFGNVGEGLSDTFSLSSGQTNIVDVTPTPVPTLTPTPEAPVSIYPDQSLPPWTDGGGVAPSPYPVPSLPNDFTTAFPPFGEQPATPQPTLPLQPLGQPDGGSRDTYGSPLSPDIYESAANSMPQAMVQQGERQPAALPQQPTGGPLTGLDSLLGGGSQQQPVADQGTSWTPSPAVPSAGQQTTTDQPSSWQPSPPQAAGQSLTPPPAPLGQTPEAMPPPTLGSGFGGDSLFGDGGSFAPPPVPQAGSALGTDSQSPPDSLFGDTGLKLPDAGGADSLFPPAQDGGSSLLRPPGDSQLPPFTQPDIASLPPQGATQPQAGSDLTSLLQPPAGQTDSLVAPPPDLGPSAPRRQNPRDASNHYVEESKSFREDGRMDLALRSAQLGLDSDRSNPAAYIEIAQVHARSDPPDFVSAANFAKEGAQNTPNWETWWNCADVYYIWAHAVNREMQAMLRSGQNPPIDRIDERNATLSNALVAIRNASSVLEPGDREAAKKVAITFGMITYLRALTVPEPVNPGADSGPAHDEYRRQQALYKSAVTPLLLEAMPYFQNALGMGGAPGYNELFQMGIINFRLAGMERDAGNTAQATTHYEEAAKFLMEATNTSDAPKKVGPREAYYMLALCYDELSNQAGPDRSRHKELALRYWRQTAEFYEPGTPYRTYGEQRIEALMQEMGR